MKKLLSLFLFLISGFVSYAIADVTAPSGRFLQIRTTLQPGSTVYFSSGTVQTYLSANGIMSLPHSAAPPPTDCDTDDERGRIYIDTNATSGRQIYACEGTLGWILQGDGSSGGGGGTTILLKDGGSSIVNTSTINFTGATFAISNSGGEGLVAIDFSTIPSRSDVILNQNTLQSGTTFYTSSGTVTEFNSSTITITKSIRWPDGTVQVSSPVAGVGSSPGGSNTNIQFNDSGSFSGEPNFSWNKSSDTAIILSSYTYGSNISAITIISTAVFTSSPSANIAFQFFNTASSTQTVFQIQPTQFHGDTSTSTLVSFNVRGDNVLDTVMRIGEPRNSTVPYVEFPTTGTRLNFKGISDDDAYIENNTSSSDLVIAPPPNVGRIRMGSGAKSDVVLLLDTGSSDGDMTWDGTNDVLKVSDDIQMQAQNEVRFADSDSSNYVGFKSSGTVTSNAVYTLPSADGTSGQALVTNGNKVLSFATISGGGGGGSSSLEVFSNFDATRTSPTASISIGDALKLSVSGSTAVVTVDFSTIPSRSDVILNQNTLQTGSTFYVSSGTIQGQFIVQSPPASGGSTVQEILTTTIRSSSFQPASKLELRMVGNSGFEIRGASTDGIRYGFMKLYPPGLGSPFISSFGSEGISELMSLRTNEVRISTDVSMYNNKSTKYYDTDNDNFVAFRASSSLSTDNTYVWMPSSGPAGRAIITDGKNNFSFGLSSAASNTTENNFPMGDANGSLQPSPLNYLASYPIFTGTVVYGDNILALGDMGGLTASLVNGALNAKMSLGVGSGFTTTYRVNFPDTPLGAYQAWTSTGPTGNLFQLQNTTVIVSTSGLQPGASFYVSSGTVVNVAVTTITFNDASKLATAPEKEYWWPASATLPLEASNDSIAPVVLTTATAFDLITTDFDSATDECRSVNFLVSTNTLIGVSTVTFSAYWMSASATTGNVGFYLYHNNGAQDGEGFNSSSPQTHSSTFDAVKSTTDRYTVTSWDVSVSSLTWRGGDLVDGKFCRDADNASDTMSGDAKVAGFGIRFKRL